MKSFSERKGLKPASEIIQTDGMTPALRTGLWNVLHLAFWSQHEFLYGRNQYDTPQIEFLSKRLWFQYFKKPIDKIPDHALRVVEVIREYFFGCKWHEVYDFIEFIVQDQKANRSSLPKVLNEVLERELSGYRVVDGVVVDITSEQEIQMLDEALSEGRFGGVAAHLRRALELYSNRESPDYRNSIKESISAVEAMARIVAGNPKAILPDALKALEKGSKLHPALKDGFVKLYGYTSDESGIRHAMLEEPNLTASDARFFLLSCTSFVNYLKAQLGT